MAEYRTGHPLAGFAQLMSNERLTWLQDLGAVTELLSGAYYAPLGRSSSHQMWSSAMVLTPAVRGLFGLEPDIVHHRLRLHPNLPATWNSAELSNIPYGTSNLAVQLTRERGELVMTVRSSEAVVLCVDTQPQFDETECKTPPRDVHVATLKLPGVEVGFPDQELLPGDRTHGVKVLEESYAGSQLTLNLQGISGTQSELPIRLNNIALNTVHVEGARIENDKLVVTFPAGQGYRSQPVAIRW